MGWKLFGYYTYWFYWTLATFPGAFIAWYIKRDDWIGSVVHSVALIALIWIGTGYLKQLIEKFPHYLLSVLFCFGSVPVLIMMIHHQKAARMTASVIVAVALAVLLIVTFIGYNSNAFSVSIGLDEKSYPVTEGWKAELEDPDNGTVELTIGEGIFGSTVQMEYKDYTKDTNVILRDPEGNAWLFPVEITKNGDSFDVSY